MFHRNKKLEFLIVIGIVIFTFTMYLFDRYDKNRIYNRVLRQEGYQLYEIQNPVTFSAFIEPEWIPTWEGEEIELNMELYKIDNVSIVITSTIHRGTDIYFNFDGIPEIKYKEGQFLSHYLINQDGTGTTISDINAFKVYNKENFMIDIGQRGFGPVSKFGFCLNIEDYDQFSDGFTVDYNNSILYGYYLSD